MPAPESSRTLKPSARSPAAASARSVTGKMGTSASALGTEPAHQGNCLGGRTPAQALVETLGLLRALSPAPKVCPVFCGGAHRTHRFSSPPRTISPPRWRSVELSSYLPAAPKLASMLLPAAGDLPPPEDTFR